MIIQEIDSQTRGQALRLSGTVIISRGRIHDLHGLSGYCALIDGIVAAVIYYCCQSGECEIVSLDSSVENIGAASNLIRAVLDEAARQSCRRVWLITSNDNTRAIRFYQKRGFDLVAVHREAITEARTLKPSIPLIGYDGIPVRHEVEFEYSL